MYKLRITILPVYIHLTVSFSHPSHVHTMYITTRIYRIFPTPVYRVQLCHPYSSHVNFNHFRIFFSCVLLFGAFFPKLILQETHLDLSYVAHIIISLFCSFLFFFISFFLCWKMCVYVEYGICTTTLYSVNVTQLILLLLTKQLKRK